jgi:hypothetical protein
MIFTGRGKLRKASLERISEYQSRQGAKVAMKGFPKFLAFLASVAVHPVARLLVLIGA